jgi:hypothetical protein
MKTPNWEQANCAGTDSEAFFSEYPRSEMSVMALRVCANCDIIETCREYAIKHEKHGIWGGMNATERSAYRKKNNIALETPSMFDYIDHLIGADV